MQKGVVTLQQVISNGGEIVGSRSRLAATLQQYGVAEPQKYLREVTTRQAHQDGRRLFDALEFGGLLVGLNETERKSILDELIDLLRQEITAWFQRQNLSIHFERHHSPVEWIRQILDKAGGRSFGIVEQPLVGASLQVRHPQHTIANFPSHAADIQTGRAGDFLIGRTVYHVTSSPTPALIEKCIANLQATLSPMVLVPSALVGKAKSFAEYRDVHKRLSVISIEDFIALNLIELSNERDLPFIDTLRLILNVYNARIEAVETDLSTRIDVP